MLTLFIFCCWFLFHFSSGNVNEKNFKQVPLTAFLMNWILTFFIAHQNLQRCYKISRSFILTPFTSWHLATMKMRSKVSFWLIFINESSTKDEQFWGITITRLMARLVTIKIPVTVFLSTTSWITKECSRTKKFAIISSLFFQLVRTA